MEITNIILQILTIILIIGLIYKLSNNNLNIFGRKGQKSDCQELLIDTSILIDGRILNVAKTGFMGGFKVVIPRSVVGELQLLADGGSDEKRSRARYGLDIISSLQHIKNLYVEILQDSTSASEGVDNRLLSLAKERGSLICTADYNLNKVAKVEGIKVLNINELAQSVRASYLPGEVLTLELTQKGNEKKQAIGHLPDGTMVVVENAEQLVGTLVEVEFIRMLQTAAGKMMFAKVNGTKNQISDNHKSNGRKPNPKSIIKKVVSKPSPKTVSKDSPKVEKKPINANKQSEKTTKTTTRRKRKTPEDSMVALANKK